MGFLSFLSASQKTSNIVFTDNSIRYLELKHTSPLLVQAYGERTLPENIIKGGKIIDEQTLSFILEECVEEWGMKGRSVRFIVPDPFVVLRKVTIPGDIKPDEIEGYLFLEIGTSIHLPFEDPVFDYALIHELEGNREVLLVASHQDVVDSYKDLLEKVRLKPIVADISPLALYRLSIERGTISPQEHTMFLHFDENLLTVSIFLGHQPIFTRPIVLEEKNQDVLMEDHLAWRNVEDAFSEIEKVMNFYQYSLHKGEFFVERALISGDHPNLRKIETSLKDRLNIPVHYQSLKEIKTVEDGRISDKFVIALGLALKEVQYVESH
ncbi:type IV pilus biogenesis protein PilM [Rossellomorea vietnamensis]|uniref:type IV pilus biogenesis protein PilM n=1 Tax=Rossellomorea vietnamensis TaxID=218284 RepID=UPI000556A43A|nr:pilus assembly protein PilM [Rossellomorea vietnamensis]